MIAMAVMTQNATMPTLINSQPVQPGTPFLQTIILTISLSRAQPGGCHILAPVYEENDSRSVKVC